MKHGILSDRSDVYNESISRFLKKIEESTELKRKNKISCVLPIIILASFSFWIICANSLSVPSVPNVFKFLSYLIFYKISTK